MLTGERSFLQPFTYGSEALAGDIRTLTGLVADDDIATAEVAKLRQLTDLRFSLMQNIQLLAPVSDITNHAQLLRELNSGKTTMDEIRALVNQEESEAADALARTRTRGVRSPCRSRQVSRCSTPRILRRWTS